MKVQQGLAGTSGTHGSFAELAAAHQQETDEGAPYSEGRVAEIPSLTFVDLRPSRARQSR
jgi:hypothetical protein